MELLRGTYGLSWSWRRPSYSPLIYLSSCGHKPYVVHGKWRIGYQNVVWWETWYISFKDLPMQGLHARSQRKQEVAVRSSRGMHPCRVWYSNHVPLDDKKDEKDRGYSWCQVPWSIIRFTRRPEQLRTPNVDFSETFTPVAKFCSWIAAFYS
jgi:hypothetical protein